MSDLLGSTLQGAKSVSFSLVFSLGMTAVRTLLVMELLGPEKFGIWKSVILLGLVAESLNLGTLRGMGLILPVKTVHGRDADARALTQNAATVTLLNYGLIAVAAAVAGLVVARHDYRLALMMQGAVLLVNGPYNFLRELAAAHRMFSLRAREVALFATVDLVASVSLSWLFGLAGLLAATVLTSTISTIFLLSRQDFRFRFTFNGARWRQLIGVGLPFSATEYTFQLFRRLDIILISLYWGPGLLGLYSIGAVILDMAMLLLQGGISQVIAPSLMRAFGHTGSVGSVERFHDWPARFFAYSLPPLLGLGSLLAGVGVELLLPRYASGSAAAEVMIWSSFFLAIHFSFSSFFVAARKIKTILWLLGCAVIGTGAALLVVMRLGFGLTAVAWLSFASLAMVVSAETFIARKQTGRTTPDIAGFLASIYLPLAITMAIRWAMELPLFSFGMHPLIEGVVKSLILLMIYAPVWLVYENRWSLWRTVLARRKQPAAGVWEVDTYSPHSRLDRGGFAESNGRPRHDGRPAPIPGVWKNTEEGELHD